MNQKREQLMVKKRTVFGKQVKMLRKSGILPANVYGQDMKSQAVELQYKDFEEVYQAAGETGLVDLRLDSETLPVLIKNVVKDSFTRNVLHADFHKVNLKEKIRAMIPVKQVGEAKAETEKIGLLIQPLQEIEVEALPTDLPESFEVNVESLTNIGDQIQVKDVQAGSGVEITSDPEQVVFKIDELVSKETKEEAKAEEAAKAEEEAAQKAEEGAVVEETKEEVKEAEASEKQEK